MQEFLHLRWQWITALKPAHKHYLPEVKGQTQRDGLQYESLFQNFLRFPFRLVRLGLQLDKLLLKLRDGGLQRRLAGGHALRTPAALFVERPR